MSYCFSQSSNVTFRIYSLISLTFFSISTSSSNSCCLFSFPIPTEVNYILFLPSHFFFFISPPLFFPLTVPLPSFLSLPTYLQCTTGTLTPSHPPPPPHLYMDQFYSARLLVCVYLSSKANQHKLK